MLPPNDPHDARHADARMDNLVLLALGEPVEDWFETHRAGCEECQRELNELRATVALGREGTDGRGDRMPVPPDQVWDRIARELDLPSGRKNSDGVQLTRREQPPAAAPK